MAKPKRLNRDAKVKVLVKENPFSKGCLEAGKWTKARKKGIKTVADLLDAGINGVGVRRAADRGWIEIAK